jgi:hypothetical protein
VKEEEEETGGSPHPLPLCWPTVTKRRRTAVSLLSPVTAASAVHPQGSNCAEAVMALDKLAGGSEAEGGRATRGAAPEGDVGSRG